MAQTVMSVRVDKDVKEKFDSFCEDVGLNPSVAINMYIKAVLREHKIPFEITNDPFYSESNQKWLKESVKQAENGNLTQHELIED